MRTASSRTTTLVAACLGALALAGVGAAPAQAADDDDPQAAVNMSVTASGLGTNLVAGTTYNDTNVVSVDPVSGVLPAGAGTMTFTLTGPAVFGTATPYSISPNGRRSLGGCTGAGTQQLICTNGVPWQTSGGNYNHIRVPFAIDAAALPGDVVTLTSELTTRAGYPNSNPSPVDTSTGSIPLTAATITTAGVTGPTPTITGTGVAADATVDVSVAGRPPQTVAVQPDGSWSLAVTDPLPDGAATITAVQRRNGLVAPAATGSITVDAVPPASPTIDDPGTWPDGTGVLTGTADPGSTVVVRDAGGVELGRAVADAVTGEWRIPVSTPLPGGVLGITAVALDEFGNASDPVAAAITVPVVVVPVAPAPDDQLAASGVDDAGLGGAALALTLAGGILLALRRRDRASTR